MVFEGTPADLVTTRSTLTGHHLAEYVTPGRALRCRVLPSIASLSLISADVAITLGPALLRFRAVATANGQMELPFHVVRIVLGTETVPLRPSRSPALC